MELATAASRKPVRLEPAPLGREAAVSIPGPELSIIVPTFNERDNIAELLQRLRACLPDAAWEVVFVDDDSPDGTADLVRRLAAEDSRIRLIQRIGRRGLSSACVEGMLSSSAAYLAVIDADLQHDERLLPRMLEALQKEETDIVIGSRYAAGGDIGDWSARRASLSRLATRISRLLVPAQLTDPMSGFFMMRREVFTDAQRRLSSLGFKILADLFASSPRVLRFKELSYTFGVRHAGVSKFDSASAWDFAMLVLDKLVGRWVPVRFLAFSIVGSVGVAVHFAVLSLLFTGLKNTFLVSQAAAIACAMTFNFAANNLLTYHDRRLRGLRWVRGWVTFMLACSVGALMNLGLAGSLYRADHAWPLAALGGILVGAIWNYVATTFLTWGRPRA
jgi:dolichol-phosphate mannosyltransferase